MKTKISHLLRLLPLVSLFGVVSFSVAAATPPGRQAHVDFRIPSDYLREPEEIPAFWLNRVEDVAKYLAQNVKKGRVEIIGTSAGERAIPAVFYGKPREGRGTSTFSGSLGYGNTRVFRGPDHQKTVYLAMAGVHGGEFDGMVGVVNLISVLETGKDLRGKAWPELTEAAAKIDRLIVIPHLNPDGRARVPLRMLAHRGTDNTVYEYFNTGGKADGTNLGWPQVKEFIPLDFSKTSFPGGYPNDAGVNLQHDDFLGARQPETQALLDLVGRERPDLVVNMHTGVPPHYIRPLRSVLEPALQPIWERFYRNSYAGLERHGLLMGLNGNDEGLTSYEEPSARQSPFNLNSAINFHSGAMSFTVESPNHGFSGKNKAGELVRMTPDIILDCHLVFHTEAIKFLAQTGGRARWITPPPYAK